MKTTKFIKDARQVHGDLYDYSMSIYKNANTPLVIRCPTHGEFAQRPSAHIRQRQGCPKCGFEKRKIHNKKTSEIFVKEAREKWGEKYDYANTVYKNKDTKIIFRCHEHGDVTQMPRLHLKSGCPFCSGRGIAKYSVEAFIKKAESVHGNCYDYSKVHLNSINDKVVITCPKHGDFKQKAANHINLGNGCPKCNGGVQITSSEFISKASEKHSDRFDYSSSKYTKSHAPIQIICPKHGAFSQMAYMHLQSKHACPRCVSELTSSQAEAEIRSFIANWYTGQQQVNERSILEGSEIDVYLPSKRLGFEFHGNYWHCDKHVDRNYHLRKAEKADSAGIHLVQIFEYEWNQKREIVESRIRSLLQSNVIVFARKTKVVELSRREKNQFLEKTHIQGRDNSSISYGLVYNDQIVACMTFGKPRYDTRRDYELIRYSSEIGINVAGGASKLFTAFKRRHSGSIVSYADRRWSTGNLYRSLGFVFDGFTKPGYVYLQTSTKKIFGRVSLQKHRLKNMPHYDSKMSADEILELNNFCKLWNAGNSRWVHEMKKPRSTMAFKQQ